MERYQVLFADTFGDRHCQFRVKGATQRHVHSLEEFKRVVRENKWNAVFIPSYWSLNGVHNDKDQREEALKALLDLSKELRPDVVIYHGLCDDSKMVSRLKEAGILAAHIPWNVSDLSDHERMDVKEPLQ